MGVDLLKGFCENEGIAAIYEANGASSLLSEGQEVIVDANMGLVFSKTTMSRDEMLAFK